MRGGGPGTRETDLLDPRNLVDRVHAIVLTGGSALGLAAADGVAQALLADGVGFPVGMPPQPGHVVPIVPAAVIFDLGRGGAFGNAPDAALGAEAYAAASTRVAEGIVGAGHRRLGRAGSRAASAPPRPGCPTARPSARSSSSTPSARPSTRGPASCGPPGTAQPGDLPDLRRPDPADLAALRRARAAASAPPPPGQATTLAVVATDATLTKAQCAKVAGIGHDGLARALNPVHTMLDGDTVFAAGDRRCGRRRTWCGFHALLAAAGDVVTRAIARAVVAAESTHDLRSYRDVFPSAFGASVASPG